jgi:hypothetical protein
VRLVDWNPPNAPRFFTRIHRRVRQTRRLCAEEQPIPRAVRPLLRVRSRAEFGKRHQPTRRVQPAPVLVKRIPIVVHPHAHRFPVIQPRAFQLGIIQRKPQRSCVRRAKTQKVSVSLVVSRRVVASVSSSLFRHAPTKCSGTLDAAHVLAMHPVFPGIFGVTKTTAKSVRCPSLAVSMLRTRTADMSSSSSSSSFTALVVVDPRPRRRKTTGGAFLFPL